jgi:hypothetical protein
VAPLLAPWTLRLELNFDAIAEAAHEDVGHLAHLPNDIIITP